MTHAQFSPLGARPDGLPSDLWLDPTQLHRGRKMDVKVTLADDGPIGRAGQLVKLDLAPTDVHTSEEDASYLAGYALEDAIADEVSPVIPVEFSFGQYRNMSRDNAFLRVKVKTHPRAKVNEIEPETEMSSYVVIERAIGTFLDNYTTPQGAYDVRAAAMDRCIKAIMLDREIDVKDLLTTTSNWTTGFHTTLGATAKWNEGSTSNPILDLHTRMEASNQKIKKIVMARHVANAFTRHPLVRDFAKNHMGQDQMKSLDVSDAATISIPTLPLICVTDHKYTETAGVTPSWTWGNDVVLVSVPNTVPTHGEAIATSYTRRYRGPNGTGIVVREFPDDSRGSRGGNMIVVAMAEIAQMTSSTCGGLIKAAYQ